MIPTPGSPYKHFFVLVHLSHLKKYDQVINFAYHRFLDIFFNWKKTQLRRNLHGDPDHGEAFSIGFFRRQRRQRYHCRRHFLHTKKWRKKRQ